MLSSTEDDDDDGDGCSVMADSVLDSGYLNPKFSTKTKLSALDPGAWTEQSWLVGWLVDVKFVCHGFQTLNAKSWTWLVGWLMESLYVMVSRP